MLEVEYKKWLESEGYQPTTLSTSISSTRAAERIWLENKTFAAMPKAYAPLLRRYSRFLHSVPFPRWSPFERFVVDSFEATRAQPRGASKKEPLTSRQWRALVSAVCGGDDPADEVLCIVLSLPELEPHKILSTPIAELRKQTGSELLSRLKPSRAYRTLAAYISTSEAGAYKRIHRQLNKHAETLGFEVDFFSLARTPAEVRASAKVA